MKVKRISLAIIISLVAIFTIIFMMNHNSKDSSAYEPKADLSFVVLGDVHDSINGFQNAVNDFYSINKSIDALVLNGDTVDEGKDEQYKDMNKIISKNKNKLPDIIIKNIGNHEFYNYDYDSDSKEDMIKFMNRYLEFSGNEKVYNDQWIKGYHFISLGSDDVENEGFNATMASLTEEQLSWFRETLKDGYEKGKPIFVFLHQPISADFFGKDWSGVVQKDEIKEILSNYPEVVIFSSHTHKDFDDDCIKENMPFTMVHTGAVGYTLIKDENSENGIRRDSSYNNGLYVEVNGNNVTVKGRNIADHEWVFSKDLSINDTEN